MIFRRGSWCTVYNLSLMYQNYFVSGPRCLFSPGVFKQGTNRDALEMS